MDLCSCMLCISLILSISVAAAEKGIASKQQSEKIHKRCPYTLRKLWQTDISSFPFAAAPLVVDVDGDGGLDIVAAPFGEALAVIEGEKGKHLHDTSWPQHNLDKSLHSSPLQYDIDGDGIQDLLFITSQGEGLFYTGLGYALLRYTFQLKPAYVKSKWYTSVASVDYQKLSSYVSEEPLPDSVPVDPHVLSTPVIHSMQYLVIPVSYFFNEDDYAEPDHNGPWGSPEARDKFYLGAVAVVDLKELRTARNKEKLSSDKSARSFINYFFLELSQTPLFSLFSPTVIDVDGDFGAVEIITGLSSGNLYVMSLDGKHRPGFPVALGPISGTISAADLDNNPGLELIALNTTGTAVCLDSQTGILKWSAEVGGTTFAGSQIVDVDIDGQLDVVVATDEGNVFALNGRNGSVLPMFPYKAGRRIAGRVLVTKFNVIRGPFDLVFLSDDGILHILAADHSCLSQIALADTSLVDLIMGNIVLLNRGMELIVATSDGSLICLGSGSETPPEELIEEEFQILSHRLTSPSGPVSPNDFVFSMEKVVVLIGEDTRYLKEVTGSSLDLYFTIHGAKRDQEFELWVYMGSDVVHQQKVGGSDLTWLKVRTPEQPGQAQITIVIHDRYGFVSSDSIFLKFNQLILLDLQWLILAPFIAMVIILLVNHGFPAKDLLPVTFPFKSK